MRTDKRFKDSLTVCSDSKLVLKYVRKPYGIEPADSDGKCSLPEHFAIKPPSVNASTLAQVAYISKFKKE